MNSSKIQCVLIRINLIQRYWRLSSSGFPFIHHQNTLPICKTRFVNCGIRVLLVFFFSQFFLGRFFSSCFHKYASDGWCFLTSRLTSQPQESNGFQVRRLRWSLHEFKKCTDLSSIHPKIMYFNILKYNWNQNIWVSRNFWSAVYMYTGDFFTLLYRDKSRVLLRGISHDNSDRDAFIFYADYNEHRAAKWRIQKSGRTYITMYK